MSHREDTVLLRDMLEHARLARQAIHGRQREDLDRDRVLLAALERFIEIVGEAASQLSEDGRRSRPNIPWPQIIAMRNRLIHGYPSVDEDIIWKVVQNNIPDLIAKLERELS